MNTLTLSAHSLDKAACPARYFYYRHAHGTGRTPVGVVPALAQGIAGHGALAIWRKGPLTLMTQEGGGFPAPRREDDAAWQARQDAFVDRVFAAHPPPPEDYRGAAYLKDALRQYKAEHRETETFDFEAVEDDFDLPLGTIGGLEVRWSGRADAVGVNRLDGRRYLIDNKFVSRDEQAELSSARNSRALKGYVWSWQQRFPDKPIHGVMLRRLVIRKPTKARPLNIDVPLDPPLLAADLFTPERLEEWREGTLRLAAQIAAHDPASPADWPMDESHCRHTWGCCDYLGVCTLPPKDRLTKLGSDAFRAADQRGSYEVTG